MTQLGASYAVSDRVSLRGSIPVGYHWGSTEERISGDGFGFGDLSAGLRYQFWEGQGVTLGAHGDLTLNVGTRNRYMGEIQPRTYFGLLGAGEVGPLLVMTNVGIQTRTGLDTKLDFELGNELVWNSAGVLTLPNEVAAVSVEFLSRYGMKNLFQGGAETSVEWTAGVQYPLTDTLRLDAGVGRGLTAGYGTTTYRGILGIRYERRPKPQVEEPEFIVSVLDIPDDEPDIELPDTEDPPDEWRPGERVKEYRDRLEIRDPIQFEFATARILPESLPTLKQIGAILNRDARIGHLLIEGHASEEGSFAYNYDLSARRAKAIFEQLIVIGVHPERMSYRGMGEVVPIKSGSDEASLASNRRVEFEIVRQDRTSADTPELRRDIKLPWNGAAATVDLPPPLPDPEPEEQDLLEETIKDVLSPDDVEGPTDDDTPSPAAPDDAPTTPEEAP
jgi:outer membrane protein OmpA-like peptidoglycan-associated protein